MSNFDKYSRIGTILHDKDLYRENNKQSPKYISLDEYNFNMMLIQKYNDEKMLEKQKAANNNRFNAFCYIPIRIYNSALYARSKISYI